MSRAAFVQRAAVEPIAKPKTQALSRGLRIGAPDDAYEREAARAADVVMSVGSAAPKWSLSTVSVWPSVQRKCDCGGAVASGGACKDCEDKKESLLRSSHSIHEPLAETELFAPRVVHEALDFPGRPLDATTRDLMERRFQHDFGQVRVHTDAKAGQSAQSINASAYTYRHDVFFGPGQYAPETTHGKKLLAHELAHVIQNKGQSSRTGAQGAPAGASAGNEFPAATIAKQSPSADAVLRRQEKPPAQGGAAAMPSVCGPDATDWFIAQVAKAKSDPTVRAIKQKLAGAHSVATQYGFSAERVAEGGVAKKVLAEETNAGSPARTPTASAQIAASAPGQREFGRALIGATIPLPFVGAPEQIVLAAIKSAASAWKDLVGTKKKYDFKYDSVTMRKPKSEHCPAGCENTITLCPSSGSDCFPTDAPGNLFYAHIGKFIGWTELSLQLGSEFAQLESTRTWDPPEDTRMISIGFALPDPLSRADFCSAITSNRTSFSLQPCNNCPEPTKASLV